MMHNHGTEDGPGWACRESYDKDGTLVGRCLLGIDPTHSPVTEVFCETAGSPRFPSASFARVEVQK